MKTVAPRQIFCLLMLIVTVGAIGVPQVCGQQSVMTLEEMVDHLLDMADLPKGVCVVLGGGDDRVALEMARREGFFVHLIEPNEEKVIELQDALDVDGLYGKRLVVEQCGYEPLPYVENSIDLIVSTHLTSFMLEALKPAEIMKALCPNGSAILGNQSQGQDVPNAEQLKAWLKDGGIEDYTIIDEHYGLWIQFSKTELKGTDDWRHWEKSPDNNPVSNDQVIKAPYMTKWMGKPYYIAMPAITTAAGGRLFIGMGHIAHHRREEQWLNTLLARNAYNGTILWTRKLPDGYLTHRSAFIATPETFYMIDVDGNGCLMLDAKTGEEKGEISIPGLKGEWKWMAMKDGKLYALSGPKKDPAETTVVRSEYPHWSWGELSSGYYQKRVPWGFGRLLAAYDLEKQEVLWTFDAEADIDSRAMVMGGGRVFYYGPDLHLGCLDAFTGKEIWKNDDQKLIELIEQPGRGLTSTPGFRSMCYCLYTPEALFFEAQTRMNVVAVSLKDGSLLWSKRKTSSNPNMLYLNDKLIVGIGDDGSTLLINPADGEIDQDLGFKKRSCARLTATPDSLFCRGWWEGLTRFDRSTGNVQFNGAFRPSCNDGVIAAHGHLYLGPWACDCNLSLMGRIALCSAGDFDFDIEATNEERLHQAVDFSEVKSMTIDEKDWPTYRANNSRSASSKANVANDVQLAWEFQPETDIQATTVTAANGLIYLAGDDGKVRALDSATGKLKWHFKTAGPIMQPPSIWKGRAYVGSGDGFIYALDATNGKLLWRFRAAPVERRTMVYGSLCSTWPVNSGVYVEDGVAYAAAGIIDYDGTYIYALDAETGEIIWQNNSSGHLDKALRKGISAQGMLTSANGRLWMAGGNVISPAVYDLKTGEYVGGMPVDGSPQANRGEEISILNDQYVLQGGRLRFSAAENVVNPGSFASFKADARKIGTKGKTLVTGKIPPAWNDERMVVVNGLRTTPTCWPVDQVNEYLAKPAVNERRERSNRPNALWSADDLKGGDTVGLVIAGDSVLTISEMPQFRSLYPRWKLFKLDLANGKKVWEKDLQGKAIPGGLTVDRDGRVIVVMDDGHVKCFAGN